MYKINRLARLPPNWLGYLNDVMENTVKFEQKGNNVKRVLYCNQLYPKIFSLLLLRAIYIKKLYFTCVNFNVMKNAKQNFDCKLFNLRSAISSSLRAFYKREA